MMKKTQQMPLLPIKILSLLIKLRLRRLNQLKRKQPLLRLQKLTLKLLKPQRPLKLRPLQLLLKLLQRKMLQRKKLQLIKLQLLRRKFKLRLILKKVRVSLIPTVIQTLLTLTVIEHFIDTHYFYNI